MNLNPAKFILILLIIGIGVLIFFKPRSSSPMLSNLQSGISSSPTATPIPLTPTPTYTPAQAAQLQVIKATYSNALGLEPKSFTVKSGLPVRFEVYSTDDGQGCMGSIMIPQLDPRSIQFFTKNETTVFTFLPTTPGSYLIACAMGVPHAELIVE